MATVKELKAAARSRAGKRAARAERRAGRVPGVIYGDGKPPLNVSVDHAELKQRIYGGRFLPRSTARRRRRQATGHSRDFQLDAVKDLPVRGFPAAGRRRANRVRIPVHVMNADQAPGVKRGGTVNIVTHTVEVVCSPEHIPDSIDVDVSGLEINYSKHLNEVRCRRTCAWSAARSDAGDHRAAVGLCGRDEGGCRSRRRCAAAAPPPWKRALPPKVRLRARRPARAGRRSAAAPPRREVTILMVVLRRTSVRHDRHCRA
jgi:ribosomal protein bL25 (Ctc-form)